MDNEIASALNRIADAMEASNRASAEFDEWRKGMFKDISPLIEILARYFAPIELPPQKEN